MRALSTLPLLFSIALLDQLSINRINAKLAKPRKQQIRILNLKLFIVFHRLYLY